MALWLSAKFSISVPYVSSSACNQYRRDTMFSAATIHRSICEPFPGSQSPKSPSSLPSLVDQAAALPIYFLVIVAIPVACATYIASTRWVDHRHAGFDIFCGALLGIFFAWLGFRMYNLPLSSGAGWAWGPRSRDRAFSSGVGFRHYAGDECTSSARQPNPESVSRGALFDGPSDAWAGPNQRPLVPIEGVGGNG